MGKVSSAVVFFDMRLDATHSEHWLKFPFQVFSFISPDFDAKKMIKYGAKPALIASKNCSITNSTNHNDCIKNEEK